MLLFNVVVFVLVTRVLIIHGKKNVSRAKGDKDKKKVFTNTLKNLVSIVSVMIMFGLSWLFGALSIAEAAIVFQWFFVIFSTTQGFMLFIFFCVIGTDAREEWKKLLTCYRYKGSKKGTGATPSVTSSAVNRSRQTKDTSLTSKMGNSNTIRRSVGLLPKADLESSVAPLEMSELSPTKSFMDSIVEEDTVLTIANNNKEEEKTNLPDSQLPPQILFRLKRPYYDLVVEQGESVPSTSPDFSMTGLTDALNDFEPTSLHDSEMDFDADLELTEL